MILLPQAVRGHGRWTVPAAGALALAGALTACGSASTVADPDRAPAGPTSAATAASSPAPVVCAKDAKPVALPTGFPTQAALPAGYVVTAVEGRTGSRVVVTGVSPKDFKATLADMQGVFSANGWTMSEGEVEAVDAESNFSGNGIKGRWAIRAVDQCGGNTSVSLVTGPA